MLGPAEPGRCISPGNELGELALLMRGERRTQESGVGEMIESHSLNTEFVHGFGSGHQHVIDQRRDVRQFGAR